MRKSSHQFFSWVVTSLFTFALGVGIVTAIGTHAVVTTSPTSATSAKTAAVATPTTSPTTSTISAASSTHPTIITRTYRDDGSSRVGDN